MILRILDSFGGGVENRVSGGQVKNQPAQERERGEGRKLSSVRVEGGAGRKKGVAATFRVVLGTANTSLHFQVNHTGRGIPENTLKSKKRID